MKKKDYKLLIKLNLINSNKRTEKLILHKLLYNKCSNRNCNKIYIELGFLFILDSIINYLILIII